MRGPFAACGIGGNSASRPHDIDQMVVGKAADQFLEAIEQLADTARCGAGYVARGLSAD
jgi:hypothetical protein